MFQMCLINKLTGRQRPIAVDSRFIWFVGAVMGGPSHLIRFTVLFPHTQHITRCLCCAHCTAHAYYTVCTNFCCKIWVGWKNDNLGNTYLPLANIILELDLQTATDNAFGMTCLTVYSSRATSYNTYDWIWLVYVSRIENAHKPQHTSRVRSAKFCVLTTNSFTHTAFVV